MAEGLSLKADVRERTGKGAARALRRDEKIPAVIYGDGKPAIPITIPEKPVSLALYAGGFKTNTWQLEVRGEKITVLPRDYQLEPVKDKLIHVDFLRVSARSRVSVDVPVVIVDEEDCPAVMQDGAIEIVSHTVTVDAPATRIPDRIEVSVAGLEIGATIMNTDIPLSGEVNWTTEEPFTVATITAPVAEPAEETEDESQDAGGEADASESETPG